MERAWKGLLPCVDSDVVHQLVFGFERLPVSRTILPVTHVFCVLGSSDVLHCHMGDEFIHGPEGSGAGQLPGPLLAVTPLAHQLVLDCLLGAAEERVASSPLNCHVQRFVQTQELCDDLLAVSLGADSLAVGVSPGEEVARDAQHHLAAKVSRCVGGGMGLLLVAGEKRMASVVSAASKVTIPSNPAMLVSS